MQAVSNLSIRTRVARRIPKGGWMCWAGKIYNNTPPLREVTRPLGGIPHKLYSGTHPAAYSIQQMSM